MPVSPIRRPFAVLCAAMLTLVLCAGPLAGDAHAKKKKRKDCDLTAPNAACLICKTPFEPGRLKYAAYMKRAKKPKCFDDVGCMLKYRAGMCTSTQMIMDGTMHVRDYETDEEIKAREAFFVVRSGVRTPHAYGIVAFTDRARADAFSTGVPDSAVFDYETLVDAKLADLVP